MFARDIKRRREARCLASNGADVDDTLWVRQRCLADLAASRRIQPARDCKLRCPNGVGDVDVKGSIVAEPMLAAGRILRL